MSQSKPLKEHSVPSRVQGGGELTLVEHNDRFVLDSVDGISCAEELAFLLGMSFEDVSESLQRLSVLGVVNWELESSEEMADAIEEAMESLQAENPSTAVTAAFQVVETEDSAPASEAIPVEVLDDSASSFAAPDEDFTKLAEEISARSTAEATSDFSVTDLIDQMSNSTVSVAAVPAALDFLGSSVSNEKPVVSASPRSELEDALKATPLEPVAPVDRPQPPSFPKRRDASDPALTLTPSVPIETVDVGFISTARRTAGPPDAPKPVQSQDRIPTSSHPIVPAVPTSSANRAKGGELRGIGPATPRRHLDTSWWTGTRASAEPDEVLTAREVSFSGPLPVEAGEESTGSSGELRPTLSQTPQRLERPPGGFLRARLGTGEVTDQTRTIERSDVTAEVDTLHGEDVSISVGAMEIARDSGPFASSSEGETLQMIRPLSGILPIESAEPVIQGSNSDEPPIWAEEPIRPSLKSGFGGWDERRARRISWYLRTVQGGTYYELLGLDEQAAGDEIVSAARDLRASLDMGSLHHSADAAGLEALSVIDKGVTRALDVLSNPDARAAYDAALAALAAFKV